MNKKMLAMIAIWILLLFCSCAESTRHLSGETTNITETNLSPKSELKLPANFTIDKIKSAFLEYINYRLYWYPAKIMDGISDKDFDSYIGKPVDIEIRIYDGIKEFVYAHSSIGDWLAIFKIKNGIVFCDGQVTEAEGEFFGWPSNIDCYKVIEKYSIIIPEPHKPNYGTSERKDKMIAAVESKVRSACDDFYRGADKLYTEWENVDVYIVNFYEYEIGAQAWLCRQDGYILYYPVFFEEKNNEIKAYSGKGYSMKSKNEFNEFGLFQFEREVNDAVRHFKCNVK